MNRSTRSGAGLIPVVAGGLVAALGLAACAPTSAELSATGRSETTAVSTSAVPVTSPELPPTSSPTSTTATPTSGTSPTTGPPTTTATSVTQPTLPRQVNHQSWSPMAQVGPVTLHHPADRVELVGLHQSGHDGAQHIEPVVAPSWWIVMEDRGRDTIPQGAADVVVHPEAEIRTPVTGTVIRAGSYVLYCDHSDNYMVVEPADRPGWEVKVFHVDGMLVSPGDEVQAGVTLIAPRARLLPFSSQVDDHTAEPSWPHVHIEVVDPSIPDRPTGPGCT